MPGDEPPIRDHAGLVSLVVPVRNEEVHIDECLRAVRAQTYPAELIEILVVDGDSSDATLSIVQRHRAEDERIKVLHNPDRDMPHGLNIGIRAAAGEYVGAVSGHSVLPRDYVARTVALLAKTGAWSTGGRIKRIVTTPMQGAIAAATASRIGIGNGPHNYGERAGWAETAFSGFWHRMVFDRVGLFDPRMLVNEDNEMSYRIRKAGGGIWYDPSIELGYVPRATLAGLFHQYRRYAIGKMRVLRKHRGGLRWRHFVPAAWVLFLVLGGLLAWVVPTAAWIWAAVIALYLVLVIVSSVRLSRAGPRWWLIAVAIFTLHISYGIGTWQGVLSWFSD